MNHLGLRIFYLIISWFVFKSMIYSSITTQSYFVTFFLFVMPLLIDYIGFTPVTKVGKRLRRVGVFLSSVGLLFGTLGLVGVMNLEPSIQTHYIIKNFFGLDGLNLSIGYSIYPLILFIILSVFDFVIYKTDTEVKHTEELRTEVQEIQEKKLQDEIESTLQKRQEIYSKSERILVNQSKKGLEG